MPKRSKAATERTRADILARAADLASTHGLGGLTIGLVAGAILMSKSGLFAHFGSKEELQLATVDHAGQLFERDVLVPSRREAAGLARLRRLTSGWLRFLQQGVFRGGCFFFAVAAEVADRPGRVRDRVVELTSSWLRLLEQEAEAARHGGELPADSDPAQIAFEIHAFLQEANNAFQLYGDAAVFERARRAIDESLERAGA